MKDLNKKVREKFENFFDWIKGAELVELKSCNPLSLILIKYEQNYQAIMSNLKSAIHVSICIRTYTN